MDRIRRVYERFGDRFIQRIFAPSERVCTTKVDMIGYYARRFAAKEACSKALGWGVGKITWREMIISRGDCGQPVLSLEGRAQDRLRALGGRGDVWLSMSDDDPVAMAVVVLS